MEQQMLTELLMTEQEQLHQATMTAHKYMLPKRPHQKDAEGDQGADPAESPDDLKENIQSKNLPFKTPPIRRSVDRRGDPHGAASGNPAATEVRIDKIPASAEAEATRTQSISLITAPTPISDTAVWHTVLTARMAAAFQKLFMLSVLLAIFFA